MSLLKFLKDKINLRQANNSIENAEEIKISVLDKFNELSKKIYENLKQLGYKKDGLNFRLYQEDGLCKIINLQKNRYNTKQCLEFTINIGIYFEKDDVIRNIKFEHYDCAIRKRINDDIEWWKITEDTNIDEVSESVKRALEKAFVIFKEFNSKQKAIQLILNNKAQEYSDTNVMSYDTAKLLVDMGYSNEVYELIKDTEPKHKYVFDLANQIKPNDDNKNVNTIETFNYNEKEQKFIAEINGIKFTCEEVKQKYEKVAIKIAKVYTEKLPNLIEFIINDIQDMFGEISKETVINSLGAPLIDLDTETITYLEQTLDDVHIIEVEFTGILDEFHEVCIDG